MSEEQNPKKTGPQVLELDLSSPSLEVEGTVVGSSALAPADMPATTAPAPASPPTLTLVENNAAPMASGAVEIPAPDAAAETIDDGADNLLAASLQAAMEATGQGTVSGAAQDDQLEQAVEIPLPAQGLKVTSATGELKLLKGESTVAPAATPPPVPQDLAAAAKAVTNPAITNPSLSRPKVAVPSAGTKTGMTRPALALAPKPAGKATAPASDGNAPAATGLATRLNGLLEKLGPLKSIAEKLMARAAAPAQAKKEIHIPWHAYVALGVLVLCITVYGAFVAMEYRSGPHAAWARVIKGWKKGDFELVSTVIVEDFEEIPLFIVNRYPRLVLTREADFGALIKRVAKLRHESYEKEFKKGFGSKFWEYQLREMITNDDRTDIVYRRGPKEELIFTMELRDEEWKLVDIDTTNAPDLFAIDDDDLKGEGP